MAATKTRTSIWAGITLTAGTPQTSSAVDLSTGYGAQLDLQITNGSTGPTVPAQFQIQVANDVSGTLFTNFGGPLVGSTGNSAVTSWSIDLPIGVSRVRITASGNTVQNVIIDADLSNVTGL